MELNTLHVRLTFTNAVLGTASGNPELHKTYIASKASDAPSRQEEVDALGVETVERKEKNIFSVDADGTPILWDYQVRGFMKSACSALRTIKGTKSQKVKAYKKAIDLRMGVFGSASDLTCRKLRLHPIGKMTDCERSLRAQTAMGERIAIACSESLPAGTWFECWIKYLDPGDADWIREMLDYGQMNGIGGWRNSGKGSFVWDELDEHGKVIGGNHQAAVKTQRMAESIWK